MQKFVWMIFLCLSAAPLFGQRHQKGTPFLLELVHYWPQHETIQSLTEAITNGNSVATYQVTFDAVWSDTTHPDQFPPNPHFSGLIGGTHHVDISFWRTGDLATPGIESMAETGSKFPLDQEVMAEINKGHAGFLLSGGGIGISPGSVSLQFNINRRYPRVSLVSMIAPSPDWFVGISGVSLHDGSGWLQRMEIPLFAYDAGTDSGPDYTSPNQATNPPEPIFAITGAPLLNGPNLLPLGTFVFTRIDP